MAKRVEAPEWGVDLEVETGSQMVELGEPGEAELPQGQVFYVLTEEQVEQLSYADADFNPAVWVKGVAMRVQASSMGDIKRAIEKGV